MSNTGLFDVVKVAILDAPRNFLLVARKFDVKEHLLEVQFAFFLIFYFVNHLRGRQTNITFVKQWVRSCAPFLQKNFAYLGDGAGHALQQLSYDEYLFYGSGRRYIKTFSAYIRLRPRQEPLMNLYHIYKGTSDRITIEITMNDDAMDPFVFAIVNSKNEKFVQKDRYDLQYFAKTLPSNSSDFRKKYAIMTDCPEMANVLVPKEVQDMLMDAKISPFFESLIISDSLASLPSGSALPDVIPKTINMTFKLPSDPLAQSMLMGFIFDIIDVVSEDARLGPDLRSRADRSRKEFSEAIFKANRRDREEASQKMRIEKLKKEGRLDEVNKKKTVRKIK